jgi:DNA-binding NarL/FixJ family response regulator
VSIAAELSSDLIVLDVDMPILNCLDAGQQIKELLPRVKLVYMTMNEDANLAAEAVRRGASGYFVKTSEVVIAVREVLRGRSYVSERLSKIRSACVGGKNWLVKEKDSPIGNAKSFSS